MISPQYKIAPTDKSPTAATIVAVVTATENAGAVPAIPITMDSIFPKAPLAKPAFSDIQNPRAFAFCLLVPKFRRLACGL